jgi:hypothetical protein
MAADLAGRKGQGVGLPVEVVLAWMIFVVVRRRILAWSGVRGMSPEFWRSRCSSLHLPLSISGCASR